ncbi:MAG TPA: glycosyltransferase N-terminal domain-containing protein [Gemmatimonadaceae bacterium]|nr:glycosyltransferase N-terminal domain-containing protein [Gemmatimonadaceae bacterium]
MNSLLRVPYALAGAVAQGLSYVTPEGDSKLQRGLVARRGILRRYRVWAAASRDLSRPLAWFHAPSVGEGLQALPVIQLLRARRPDVQVVYTHYSPSAEQFARSAGADYADYLPFDRFGLAASAISALRPTALVFSKLDVWPAFTETAARSNVRTGVISATLPESSARRGIIARYALGDAYRALDRVGAVSNEDAARLREQGVRAERVSVTGDTRYDQVWARSRGSDSPLVRSLRSSKVPTLVAGSTWPSDETRVFEAWIELRKRIPGARLIIAPHELSEAHLNGVAAWGHANHLTVSRIADPGAGGSDVVLVDRYGILGDLYAAGDAAYVGGGFHSAGLHSVLEPAAFGLPVLFGPRHGNSRDASVLIACGGGFAVGGTPELVWNLDMLLGSEKARDAAGVAARSMVQSGVGAAERSFQLVTELLDR